MANTITLKNVVVTPVEATVYMTLASDGSQETNTVVYDSSVVAGIMGDTDPLTSGIIELYASTGTASTARISLNFAASTPILALPIPTGTSQTKFCGGNIYALPNLALGTLGINGDITITTTGLAAGDTIALVLRVNRK